MSIKYLKYRQANGADDPCFVILLLITAPVKDFWKLDKCLFNNQWLSPFCSQNRN